MDRSWPCAVPGGSAREGTFLAASHRARAIRPASSREGKSAVDVSAGTVSGSESASGRRGAGGVDRPQVSLFAGIFDDCSDMVVLTDLAGAIVYLNQAASVAFGDAYVPGGSITASEAMAFWGEAPVEFERAVQRLLDEPDARASGEVARGGGTIGICAWRSRPLRDGAGSPIGRSFVFRDLSQERELTALKSDFLSTVTHELRTPLTSVKGALQLVLGKSAALAPVERELLGISLKNADRLIRMINDLLDISQLELGKLDLAFAPFVTGSMVQEAVAGLRSYGTGRDVTVGCDVETDLPPVHGDRDRLIQVVTNLVSNAVKFSAAGGRVLVRAYREGDQIAIAVRDWGVGISAADCGRLFRRFQRLHPERSTEPGTGLGLAISKAIVDRHGGDITVDSEEGEGSTFTVRVPAVPESIDGTDPECGTQGNGDVPTILLVDDDVDLGRVLEASLGETYRMLRVERGVQALDVARAERPDLILLDVVLPDLSGYDVLRILQHSEATGTIPIVMLTVQPEPELAHGLGAVEVMSKPVDIEALRAVIERALQIGARAAL